MWFVNDTTAGLPDEACLDVELGAAVPASPEATWQRTGSCKWQRHCNARGRFNNPGPLHDPVHPPVVTDRAAGVLELLELSFDLRGESIGSLFDEGPDNFRVHGLEGHAGMLALVVEDVHYAGAAR